MYFSCVCVCVSFFSSRTITAVLDGSVARRLHGTGVKYNASVAEWEKRTSTFYSLFFFFFFFFASRVSSPAAALRSLIEPSASSDFLTRSQPLGLCSVVGKKKEEEEEEKVEWMVNTSTGHQAERDVTFPGTFSTSTPSAFYRRINKMIIKWLGGPSQYPQSRPCFLFFFTCLLFSRPASFSDRNCRP